MIVTKIPYKCPICDGTAKVRVEKYRFLNEGEIIAEGDEYRREKGWYKAVCVGWSASSKKVKEGSYRRKEFVEEKCTACVNGVIMCEQIDYNYTPNVIPSVFPLDPYYPPYQPYFDIKCDTNNSPLMSSTTVFTNDLEKKENVENAEYRFLKKGEAIVDGDEYLYNGEWFRCVHIGMIVDKYSAQAKRIRRKIYTVPNFGF